MVAEYIFTATTTKRPDAAKWEVAGIADGGGGGDNWWLAPNRPDRLYVLVRVSGSRSRLDRYVRLCCWRSRFPSF